MNALCFVVIVYLSLNLHFFLPSCLFLIKVSELQAVNAELQKRLALVEKGIMGNAQTESQGQLDLIGLSLSSQVIRNGL